MANVPTKPPVRVNSQQPAVHHDTAQQQQRSRELHPAAAEAMARYTAVWDENDRLHSTNVQLAKENEVLKKIDVEKTALISDLRRSLEEAQRTTDARISSVEAYYRERLAESERSKERYLRFAVSINERLSACVDDITAARDTAMEMAQKVPDHTLDDIEERISSAVKAAHGAKYDQTQGT